MPCAVCSTTRAPRRASGPVWHRCRTAGTVPARLRRAAREDWERDPLTGRIPVFLGIDVGSTSTDLVLLDPRGRVLNAQYLRTGGDARRAVHEGLATLAARLGSEVQVRAVATTGSGRSLIGKFVGADAVVDEITCQAAGAAHADPQVDTVFEIGGQDSKFISLAGGQVSDFQMNKVCAAGTGSFIEEQAARLAIPLAEYGPLALSSEAPVDLGERCTVFVESAISAALSAGAAKRDVAAGLALSIVRNYLHRVVGGKRVGSHIVLQGGVAYNPAIVEAFRSFYPDALTVSPNFAISGAVGAALMAADAAAKPGFELTAFKGFDLSGTSAAARGVDERAAPAVRYKKTGSSSRGLMDKRPGQEDRGHPALPHVAPPIPLANAYFSRLGYNVLLSPDTTEEQVRLAQENARGETCYPVKLIYGHMAWLAEREPDYIFMPSLHTIRHASSRVAHNYACPYMQTAPRLVADALGLERRGIELLNPLLDMDFGQEAMAQALLGLGEQLGHTRQEAAVAMMAGGFAVTPVEDRGVGDELCARAGRARACAHHTQLRYLRWRPQHGNPRDSAGPWTEGRHARAPARA
ncbi:MAG: acyl-CoA dehydratase activase [Collinsella sp.]